jgi:predicted transcriptional regulator
LIAKEIISQSLPAILCSDSGQKALDIMEAFRLSHLPLLRDGEYLGLISDKNVYDFELNECCVGMKNVPLISPFVYENQHIFEVAQVMFDVDVTVIPVLDLRQAYLGAITQDDLSVNLARLVSVSVPGGVIVLELGPADYVLSQIAHIVESNNAKILSMYVKSPDAGGLVEVTLKVNVVDLSAIIQSFMRYDYNIKAVYMDGAMFKNMYADRYELFMKYINT